MTPGERLIVAGAIVVAGGLLLPWYGIPFSRGLSVTAIDRFGFAHVALLLTVAAAVLVAARVAAGRPAPSPFRPWALVAAAGVWAALLVCFLMVARPEELGGLDRRRAAPRDRSSRSADAWRSSPADCGCARRRRGADVDRARRAGTAGSPGGARPTHPPVVRDAVPASRSRRSPEGLDPGLTPKRGRDGKNRPGPGIGGAPAVGLLGRRWGQGVLAAEGLSSAAPGCVSVISSARKPRAGSSRGSVWTLVRPRPLSRSRSCS